MAIGQSRNWPADATLYRSPVGRKYWSSRSVSVAFADQSSNGNESRHWLSITASRSTTSSSAPRTASGSDALHASLLLVAWPTGGRSAAGRLR